MWCIAVLQAATADFRGFITTEKLHCPLAVKMMHYYNLHPCYFPFLLHRWG